METDPRAKILERLKTGAASSPELESLVRLSQSWVSRTLRAWIAEGKVLRIGRTRSARYGLRRSLAPIGSHWPLRRIDATGAVVNLGILSCLEADQYHFEPHPRMAPAFAWTGISDGLPYFLQDQRPGGFLGRTVPARFPELGLPERILDWSDDHYLRFLTQRGDELVGDLMLGDEALNRHLANLRNRPRMASADRHALYPQLAEAAMQGDAPGSSAQGEHPKFTTVIHDDGGDRSVLVKFSPPIDSQLGRRWADLLIAEHHAHRLLTEAGIESCASQIVESGHRVFLEVTRFDRQGSQGRVGVSSFMAIDVTLQGGSRDWIQAATRLHAAGRMDAQTLECVRFVSTFGALIANTDRHFGNLACYDRYDGRFALAPIYDMLPMLFAPAHEQIVARVFTPPGPTAETLRCWGRAREWAERYWQALADDGRISEEFRGISVRCLGTLQALPRTGAYAVVPLQS